VNASTITARIDAITAIPVTHRMASPPPPRAVKIELTSQCNYRCGFCAHRLRLKFRPHRHRGSVQQAEQGILG